MDYILHNTPAATVGEYWSLWRKIEQVRPDTNRIALTMRVLKCCPKVKEMTAEQLSRMVRVFASIVRKAKGVAPAPAAPVAGPVVQDHAPVQATAAEEPPAVASVEEPALPPRLTELDHQAGVRRLQLVRAIRDRLALRHSQRDIAVSLGLSLATVNRLIKLSQDLSDAALSPESLATNKRHCGRRTDYAPLVSDPAVCQRLQQLYVATCGASSDYMSKDRRTGSASLALERFADDPLCPADLAAKLRRGAQPKCLVSVIRRITPAVEQRLRGAKHQALNANLLQRRDMTERLADGTVREIVAGDWWVFDDMSTNCPFWFEHVDGSALLGRQGLYAFDIAPRRWLGLELVGTSRDSYTSAIILRFLRRLMQALGKPRRGVIFEQGVWKARNISGHLITQRGEVIDDEWERPGMASEEVSELERGIRALGIELQYAYTPRGKEIEGAFDYLQSVFPTFLPAGAQNIGRHAGEFEYAAKQVRRVRDGNFHPRDLGFLHIDSHAELSEKVMQWVNDRETRGERQSNQRQSNQPSQSEKPQLAPLSERDLAVFLPDKSEVTIRNGLATVKLAGQPFDFVHPEIFARFGNDYRITVKFDRTEPSLGAAIYNRETSSANFGGYQLGELICFAEYRPPVHRFDFSPAKGEDAGARQRRQYNGAVRTAFRAIGLPRHGAATIRDGKGNVAQVGGERAPSAQTVQSSRRTHAEESPEMAQRGRDRLKRQAKLSRELMQEL